MISNLKVVHNKCRWAITDLHDHVKVHCARVAADPLRADVYVKVPETDWAALALQNVHRRPQRELGERCKFKSSHTSGIHTQLAGHA